jgi:hypothetical protein
MHEVYIEQGLLALDSWARHNFIVFQKDCNLVEYKGSLYLILFW